MFVPLEGRFFSDSLHMDVSENGGTPKSSILIGFSIINHPFWGATNFGNTHMLSRVFLFFDLSAAKFPPKFPPWKLRKSAL